LTAWLVIYHPITFHYSSRHPDRYHLRYEEVCFSSLDGLRIAGWYLPAKGARAVVILCHGAFADRTELMDLSPHLHRRGFAVLAFDFRQRGVSGRKRNTLGKDEVNDLLGAVKFIKGRRDVGRKPLGVIGASMGAAVAIIAAARCSDIRAVVADSAYGRLDRAVHQYLWLFFGPLKPLLGSLTLWYGKLLLSFEPSEVAPEKLVAQISPRPILLIHSRRDFLVRKSESERLFRAAKPPKRLWLTPRGLHSRSRFAYPQEYRRNVLEFLEHWLVGAERS